MRKSKITWEQKKELAYTALQKLKQRIEAESRAKPAGTARKTHAERKRTRTRDARPPRERGSLNSREKALYLLLSLRDQIDLERGLELQILLMVKALSSKFWIPEDLKNMAEQLTLARRRLRALRRWNKELSKSKLRR